MSKAKKSVHYIDNSEFLEAMKDYHALTVIAQDRGESRPDIPNYVGECFMKIAQRLSFRPNFINYAFREDMISDGIENCVQYIHNFNPGRSDNPFAYFTQIIYYAFIRRIEKEKKQLYIKYKMMDERSSIDENTTTSIHDTADHGGATMTPDQKANMYDFISTFESKKKKRKVAKKAKTTLEYFMTA